MMPQEGTMRFRYGDFLRVAGALFSVFIILTIAYRQILNPESAIKSENEGLNINKRNIESAPVWQERAPRSINKDYDGYSTDDDPVQNLIVDKSVKSTQKRLKLNPKIALNRKAFKRTPISLEDIFISVKTTNKFHKSRLNIILDTWFNFAKKQTWFFTDVEDEEYQRRTGGHMVNTGCPSSHSPQSLSCKFSKEFDAFLETNNKWWCHFDDDNYVNIPILVKTLEGFDSSGDWYLGRPSIRSPLEIRNRDNMSQKISFWFATGGAGFCISRPLALKMMPIAGGDKFVSIGDQIRLPDDVTVGYIIEHLLKNKLTIVNEFHSHLEPMRVLDTSILKDQISFGYSHYGSEMNVLPIEGLPEQQDPTRFYSLHCILFPRSASFCPSS